MILRDNFPGTVCLANIRCRFATEMGKDFRTRGSASLPPKNDADLTWEMGVLEFGRSRKEAEQEAT